MKTSTLGLIKPATRQLLRIINRHCISRSRTGLSKQLIGCELGVWRGANAQVLLAYYSGLHLTLVDDYTKENQSRKQRWFGMAKAREEAEEELKKFEDRTRWIIKKSHEAAADVDDRSLDFVYIDADHSYECTKRDILLWLPKVKIGGLLAGHDYFKNKNFHPGVTQAVDELINPDGLKKHYTTVWHRVVDGNDLQ